MYPTFELAYLSTAFIIPRKFSPSIALHSVAGCTFSKANTILTNLFQIIFTTLDAIIIAVIIDAIKAGVIYGSPSGFIRRS